MSNFFPDPPSVDFAEDDESSDDPQPEWWNPPEDVLPGVVPVELILGRSERAVVMLTGVRAFPAGLAMTLHIRLRARVARFDLNGEVFDHGTGYDQDPTWQRDRLKWGFEYADGRHATNVDMWRDGGLPGQPPPHPVLNGGSGGGGDRSTDRDYWLWPLPPAGPLKLVCQWLRFDIQPTSNTIDAGDIVTAALRSQPVWVAG